MCSGDACILKLGIKGLVKLSALVQQKTSEKLPIAFTALPAV